MEKVKITKKHLEELEVELDYLERVERPKNEEAIKDAREQGDLSENADYHAAREQQAFIAARIKEIRAILEDHELIVPKFYTLYFVDRKIEETYELVGTQEANPKEKKISNESPVGKAIDGASPNDRVTVHVNGKEFDIIVKDVK